MRFRQEYTTVAEKILLWKKLNKKSKKIILGAIIIITMNVVWKVVGGTAVKVDVRAKLLPLTKDKKKLLKFFMKHWRITLMPSARIPFRMPFTSYKVICSYVNMLTSVGDVFANSSVIVSATVSKQTIIMLYFLLFILLCAYILLY